MKTIALAFTISISTLLLACAGPEGPRGPAGVEEVVSDAGSAVVRTVVGPQGPRGEDGREGATGPRGSDGLPGATGPQGAPGPIGPEGAPGAQGLTGPQGAPGPTGPQGAQGPAGLTGAPGAAGPAGPAGPGVTKASIYVVSASSPSVGAPGSTFMATASCSDPSDILLTGSCTPCSVDTCPSNISILTGFGVSGAQTASVEASYFCTARPTTYPSLFASFITAQAVCLVAP